MGFEMKQAAVCDACGHVWLPSGELPRRCAKCKSTQWNTDAPAAPESMPVVDDGKEALELRVSAGDRRQVEFMAKNAKQDVTKFIMCRVWDEAYSNNEVAPKLELKPRGLGVTTLVEHQTYEWRHQDWYRLVYRFSWGVLEQDILTLQFFVVVRSKRIAQRFDTRAEAETFIDRNTAPA